MELNPLVRLQAREVANGRRSISDASIRDAIAAAAENESSSSPAASGDPLAAIDMDETDDRFVSQSTVEKLIASIRPPLGKINPNYRERLLRFLNRYAPYRLPHAAQLLRQYEGHEHSLFAALVAQYGPEPKLSDVDYFHEGTPTLPDGWVRIASDTRGDVFYKNTETGRRQWRRPFA